MRLLQLRQATSGPAGEVVVTQFGIGLIGSSILRALRLRSVASEEVLAFDWKLDLEASAAQLEVIAAQVRSRFAATPGATWAVVWSAGRCGFSAPSEEVDEEFARFDAALAWAERLGEELGTRPVFHFLSSAGGLFEGCGLVTRETQPAPKRPYGLLKQRQERRLREASALTARIYRPTTVYGFLHPDHRRGLIQVLLLNALRHQVTSIYGSFSTLRDFVFSEDIGEFVAQRVVDHGQGSEETYLLGSGKPSSIFEARQIVERALRQKIYVAISMAPTNAVDMAYDRSAFPTDWVPSELETGIRQIYVRWATLGLPPAPSLTT